jgi:hypothetical protein
MALAVFVFSAALAVALGRVGSGGVRAVLCLPSTLLHELAHYLMAYLTGSRPSPMDLVPRKQDGGWVLGSVTFHAGFWTAGFVALAPLLLLLLAWACVPDMPASSVEQAVRGAVFAWSLEGALPSSTDWEIALRRPAALGLTCLVVWGFLYL